MKTIQQNKKTIQELEAELTKNIENLETDELKFRLQLLDMNNIQNQIDEAKKEIQIADLFTDGLTRDEILNLVIKAVAGTESLTKVVDAIYNAQAKTTK